ncbi:MAG: hypothetical protein ACE5GW_10870, partial [Planctomycetota bacterium]
MSSPLDLRRGPLVAPAILFACGLAAGRLHPFFESAGLCLPVALGPMLLVGALLRRLRPAQIRGAAIIAGLPFCLGLLASALRTDEARPSFPAGPMEIRGTIAAAPRPRRGSARGPEGLLAPVVGLQLTGVVAEGRPLGGKLPVIVPGDPDVGRGDRLRLRGWVRQAGGPLLVRLPEHLRLIERGRDPRGVLDRLRRKIRR